ncbi:hypothetical protein M0813_07363 [Anaeramoeba flamelloides]|uniref:Uncharacterized protein n=1 Tax=Anaeramoeba flamelloides TaxID=1746091 RepID=A0ABQ8XCA5_9EUKA|nr:hypothetical protein M0813_07363 [Anaeramoeba flamelloides]
MSGRKNKKKHSKQFDHTREAKKRNFKLEEFWGDANEIDTTLPVFERAANKIGTNYTLQELIEQQDCFENLVYDSQKTLNQISKSKRNTEILLEDRRLLLGINQQDKASDGNQSQNSQGAKQKKRRKKDKKRRSSSGKHSRHTHLNSEEGSGGNEMSDNNEKTDLVKRSRKSGKSKGYKNEKQKTSSRRYRDRDRDRDRSKKGKKSSRNNNKKRIKRRGASSSNDKETNSSAISSSDDNDNNSNQNSNKDHSTKGKGNEKDLTERKKKRKKKRRKKKKNGYGATDEEDQQESERNYDDNDDDDDDNDDNDNDSERNENYKRKRKLSRNRKSRSRKKARSNKKKNKMNDDSSDDLDGIVVEEDDDDNINDEEDYEYKPKKKNHKKKHYSRHRNSKDRSTNSSENDYANDDDKEDGFHLSKKRRRNHSKNYHSSFLLPKRLQKKIDYLTSKITFTDSYGSDSQSSDFSDDSDFLDPNMDPDIVWTVMEPYFRKIVQSDRKLLKITEIEKDGLTQIPKLGKHYKEVGIDYHLNSKKKLSLPISKNSRKELQEIERNSKEKKISQNNKYQESRNFDGLIEKHNAIQDLGFPIHQIFHQEHDLLHRVLGSTIEISPNEDSNNGSDDDEDNNNHAKSDTINSDNRNNYGYNNRRIKIENPKSSIVDRERGLGGRNTSFHTTSSTNPVINLAEKAKIELQFVGLLEYKKNINLTNREDDEVCRRIRELSSLLGKIVKKNNETKTWLKQRVYKITREDNLRKKKMDKHKIHEKEYKDWVKKIQKEMKKSKKNN